MFAISEMGVGMFGDNQQSTDNNQAGNDYMDALAQPESQDNSQADNQSQSDNTAVSTMPGSINDPAQPDDTTMPDPLASTDNTTAPETTEATSSSDDKPEDHNPSFTPANGDKDDLLEIKKSALSQLGPLVGHLEQSPEEKFRTMMMMIQAADDQTLIQAAYDAAQAIPDDKARAQALLDVVNEINYFTQHHKS